MTGILSGHFAVLAAHGPDEALRLIARQGPCRLAFFEMGDDPETDLDWTRGPGMADMTVIALARRPCPPAVRDAVANGRVQEVCLLPVAPQTLLAKTRDVLSCPRPGNAHAHTCVLTREEVAFLLGTFLPTEPGHPSRRPES